MAEKNTHSILETIKKKLHKFDQSEAKTSKISDVASEFEYIAQGKAAVVENKDSAETVSASSPQETPNIPVQNQQPQNETIVDDIVEEKPVEEMSQENHAEEIADPAMQEKIEQVDEIFEEEEIEDYEDEVDFAEEGEEVAALASDEFSFSQNQQSDLSLDAELDSNQLPEVVDNLESDNALNLDNELNLELPAEVDELALPVVEESLSLPEAPIDIPESEVNGLDLDANQNQTPEVLNVENEIHVEQPALVKEANTPNMNVEDNSYDSELQALEKELEEQERKRKESEAAKLVVAAESPTTEDDIELELEKELMGFGSQGPAAVQSKAEPKIEPKVEAKIEPEIEVKKEEIVQQLPPLPKVEEIEHHDFDIHEHHLDHVIDEVDFSHSFEEENEEENIVPSVKNDSKANIIPMQNFEKKTEKKFLNDTTIMQATDSIKKLVEARNVVAGISNFSQSPALRELASEMLEPKLEKWLNDHLGQIVEEIVREEIKKIIPKE